METWYASGQLHYTRVFIVGNVHNVKLGINMVNKFLKIKKDYNNENKNYLFGNSDA